jgi:hypothetical protein
MKKKEIAITILGMLMATTLIPAQARNVKYMMSIPTALESESAKSNLDSSVKLYFGNQAYPSGTRAVTTIEAHGKVPIEAKADLASCNAAFADALKALQKNARDAGANAVVNIGSYFKGGQVVSSVTEFECHAGSRVSHVMLKGELVKIADK